jgi:hypothetical protein
MGQEIHSLNQPQYQIAIEISSMFQSTMPLIVSNEGIFIPCLTIDFEIRYFIVSLNEITSLTDEFKLHWLKVFTCESFELGRFLTWQKQSRRVWYFTFYSPAIFNATIENVVAYTCNICIVTSHSYIISDFWD